MGHRQAMGGKAVSFVKVESGKKFLSANEIIDLKTYDSGIELSQSIPAALWKVRPASSYLCPDLIPGTPNGTNEINNKPKFEDIQEVVMMMMITSAIWP
jgi:hypothetical protein